jgi:hypothetical protein
MKQIHKQIQKVLHFNELNFIFPFKYLKLHFSSSLQYIQNVQMFHQMLFILNIFFVFVTLFDLFYNFNVRLIFVFVFLIEIQLLLELLLE